MPPTPKAVLISLADNANDHGYCWPSLTTIAERTCFGRTAVIDAIKWLESAGAVRADRTDRYRTTYVVSPGSYVAGEPVREANQSARRTSSNGGALVRLPDIEVREADNEVRQADTNHQEPSRTISKATNKKRASAPSYPCPDDVSPQIWADWLTLRKAKKAPVTATVLEGAYAEAAKAEMTLEQFLRVWCRRGSQGLEADWLKPNERAGPHSSQQQQPLGKTAQALMALEDFGNGGLDQAGNRGGSEALDVLGPGAHAGSGGYPADRRRLA
ncbi:helix-turn-helix domain-containing protein [Xanthomonas campestris]|nr:helix-turn-helix domain-containing protein [Xanthomonas campestris]